MFSYVFRKTCIKLYIPDCLPELFQPEKTRQAEKVLYAAKEDLKTELALTNERKVKLKELKDKANTTMGQFIDKMLVQIEEVKKKTSASLNKMLREETKNIDEKRYELENFILQAEKNLNDLKRAISDSCNQSEQYVCSVIAETTALKCNILNKRLNCPHVKSIGFEPHFACTTFLERLGLYQQIGHMSINNESAGNQNTRYKIKDIQKVKITNETRWSNITGSCCLPDGTILITDTICHCLKRLSLLSLSTYESLDFQGGDRTPWSVCAISPQVAAVSLPDLKQVQFVYVGKKLEKTKTLQLKYACYGIAFHMGELFLCDNGSTVYVYTTSEKLLRKLTLGRSGYGFMSYGWFSWVVNIAVSGNGRLLYLADQERGLLAINTQNGNQVWQYNETPLKRATGVCQDGHGSVFVSGMDSHNVVQINECGKKLAEIATIANLVEKPISVCCLSDENGLIITTHGTAVAIVSLICMTKL